MRRSWRVLGAMLRWARAVLLLAIAAGSVYLWARSGTEIRVCSVGIPMPNQDHRQWTVGVRITSDGPLALEAVSTVHDPVLKAQRREVYRKTNVPLLEWPPYPVERGWWYGHAEGSDVGWFHLFNAPPKAWSAWVQRTADDPFVALVDDTTLAGIAVPQWSVTAATLAGLAILFQRRLRTRPQPGHCRVCGYDLRATPERCPECGTVGGKAT
jgi:hypothetical protein